MSKCKKETGLSPTVYKALRSKLDEIKSLLPGEDSVCVLANPEGRILVSLGENSLVESEDMLPSVLSLRQSLGDFGRSLGEEDTDVGTYAEIKGKTCTFGYFPVRDMILVLLYKTSDESTLDVEAVKGVGEELARILQSPKSGKGK